jgi:NADH-quinone oxidoreductase subunit A
MNLVQVMLQDYFGLFFMLLVASTLAVLLVVLSYILVLEEPDSEKLSTYECGYEPYDNSRHVFNIRFFLIAILFVIFDIEMLFSLVRVDIQAESFRLLGSH